MVEEIKVTRVEKRRTAGTLFLALLLSLFLLPPAEALDRRAVDVVEISWSGAAKPSTSQTEVMQKIDSEVRDRWETLTNFIGSESDMRIQFYAGRNLNQPILLNASVSCDRPDFSNFMNSIRTEAYRRLSISASTERYLIILMPEANCIWQGRSLIGSANSRGGTIILQDTSDAFVIAHELGHSLGLGHSNFIRCDSGLKDGPWSNCKAVEYGGTVDLMGNVPTSAPLSTYHQWRIGLMTDSQVRQVWNTETISISAVDMGTGIKSLFLRDGLSTYWIEYRRERLESGYRSGLVIYRTDPPPSSSVLSPNIEDKSGITSSFGVTSDMWLINLDNFNYANSRSSGSMTLGLNKEFVFFSGKISIGVSAISQGQESATVTVRRSADLIAPPRPSIISFGELRNSEDEVLQKGFEDKETFINSFEIKRNEQVVPIPGVLSPLWRPTYLQPFNKAKVLTVGDLPEGKYLLSVRTIDFAGNKSEWSAPQSVNIDRGAPLLLSNFTTESIDSSLITYRFDGIVDPGSQLCGTYLYNEFDYVIQTSKSKSAPSLIFPINHSSTSRIQATDCLGNSNDGKFEIQNSFISPDRGSRTGTWRLQKDGVGSMQSKCIGKCSLSLSVSGSITLLVKASQAEISIAGRKAGEIKDKNSSEFFNLDVGNRKRILRLAGRDLIFSGIVQSKISITEQRQILSVSQGIDPTLNLASQKKLIGLGFKGEDFVNSWRVLPIAGGTETADPTLDLCNPVYDSDKSRLSRRQVSVTKASSPYVFLSSESVQYSSAAAADLALAELRRNYETCKKAGGWKDSTGSFTKYEFRDVSYQEGILGKDSIVIVSAVIGEGENRRTLFAVYQFKNDFFTGLYVVKDGEIIFSERELSQWTLVAKVFAERLKLQT